MTTELATLIQEEHARAELQRLNDGWPGCGCANCQELYQAIDLTKYGSRVKRNEGGVIAILEDLKKTAIPQVLSDDHWTDGDMTFVHAGKKYRLTPQLKTICVDGVVDTPPKPHQSPPDGSNGVSKLPDGNKPQGIKPPKLKRGVVLKHPGGRPKKKGKKVSRVTRWRREKEKQGALL